MSQKRLVVQISDTHVVHEGLLHGHVDSFANLSAIMDVIEPCHPDAVLLTGDLADSGHPGAYRRIRDLVQPVGERLGAPVVYMPGNHDDRENLRRVLVPVPAEGPIDQVIWAGGLRIIALDSSVPGAHHGELRPFQLEMLRHELASPAPEGTILAVHHQPLPSPSKIANLLSLRQPEALGEVVRGTDVMMVLAGHTHHAGAGLLAGVPVWVSTASAYQADVMCDENVLRGIPGVAFTRIDVIDRAAYATQVAMAIGQEPVYVHDISGIEERLATPVHGAVSRALGLS